MPMFRTTRTTLLVLPSDDGFDVVREPTREDLRIHFKGTPPSTGQQVKLTTEETEEAAIRWIETRYSVRRID